MYLTLLAIRAQGTSDPKLLDFIHPPKLLDFIYSPILLDFIHRPILLSFRLATNIRALCFRSPCYALRPLFVILLLSYCVQ